VNDYLRGHIDCCLELANSKGEFINLIKRTTGLTDSGIDKSDYIQEKVNQWFRNAC